MGTQEQTLRPELLDVRARSIIGGDLNGHGSWDPHQPEDGSGQHIDEWVTENNLIIKTGDKTQINPATGGLSALDAIVATTDITSSKAWSTGVPMGSDHLPILMDLGKIKCPTTRRGRDRFTFKKAD